MKKIFVLTLFISLFVNLPSQNSDLYSLMKDRNEFYFSFQCDNIQELGEIFDAISIDKIDGDNVVAYANGSEYENFLTLGYKTTLLLPPSMSDVYKMYDGHSRDEYEWDEYPTYEAYEAMMYDYAETYSDNCSLLNLGTLQSGRKILLLRINNGKIEGKPKFLLCSTIHGDETTGFIIMLRLIDELLCRQYLPEVQSVLDNIDLFICPNMNPDGTYKNGNHTVAGATRFNAFGIDMNRNYPDCIKGTHPDDENYAYETELFMKLADEYQFTMSANYHGGAEVINYPWDNTYEQHVDDDWWYMIARQYADLTHEINPEYMTDRDDGVTNGADWYKIYGSRQDYMNYYEQCRELTVECSKTKCLPASELPVYWEYNRNAIFALLAQVNCGIQGTVKDKKTKQALNATVKVLEYDCDYSVVESQLPLGDFYRPIKAGSYLIEIEADGYYPVQKNVDVIDGERLVLNIELDAICDAVGDNVLLDDSEKDDIRLYPNPVENVLSIDIDEVNEIMWDLIDGSGRVVKQSNNAGDFDIKLDDVESGAYLLKLIFGEKQVVKRIVVR